MRRPFISTVAYAAAVRASCDVRPFVHSECEGLCRYPHERLYPVVSVCCAAPRASAPTKASAAACAKSARNAASTRSAASGPSAWTSASLSQQLKRLRCPAGVPEAIRIDCVTSSIHKLGGDGLVEIGDQPLPPPVRHPSIRFSSASARSRCRRSSPRLIASSSSRVSSVGGAVCSVRSSRRSSSSFARSAKLVEL